MSQCLNPDCLQLNSQTTIFCQKCGSKLLLTDRYRALKILGQGGFGRTFLAVDEHKPSQPYCVIKQFLPQAQGTNNQQKAEELFKQEAIQLEQLGKHQQIPELFAYLIQDHRQYLVQEYIEGQNLAQELTEIGAFPEVKIINFLGDLLPVLAFIHQQQVIHRDIKPENIIRRKSDNKLVLVDFGAAKAATITALAVTGTVIGSAQYTAPEQAIGKPTFASDLYSLGVTCIHLLTNIEPFDLFDSGEGDWVWRDYLTVKVNNTLGQVLDKLLQPGTRKRFQTAQEVLEALQLTQKPISPPTPQPTPQPTPPPTSQPTPPPTPQTHIELKPARGVNYHQLEQLLKARKWKEADQETAKKMLEVAGRTKEGYLRVEDIDNFPCEDLRTIDQLWVKYSNGCFGFSVQKRIYKSLEGTRSYDSKVWEAFGDQVGWRVGGSWLYYKDLKFNQTAEIGYLPVLGFGFGGLGGGWGGVGVSLLSHRDL
ncbi:Serine/threonine-protein kinase B [Planktothrix tepida]|uniref:non-specific serine/threonine protein kinase n=1 Tax=Planktothrix tepida PCC 9214 TaxID=671072 RepID=A0A1J1LT99_9CYAN|nr:serine/threonine-protein kinase [Planktothrix tepida]CAD5969037.1 Serine/threonine-protein kinase B [Planktothrix tepida]CUR35234.1 Genome sequencing data, contig C297 [Planktothrix tepida PCC 9214]